MDIVGMRRGSASGQGVRLAAALTTRSRPPLHQVTPDKTGVTQYHEEAQRNGVEFPALLKAIPKICFKRKTQHADQRIEDEEFQQTLEYGFLDLVPTIAPARVSQYQSDPGR